MGAEQSAMSAGVRACVGTAPEAELKELLSGMTQKDYDKLRNTLLELQTPREPAPAAAPAAEAAKPEGIAEAAETAAEAAEEAAVEEPAAAEAAPAAEAPAAPEAAKPADEAPAAEEAAPKAANPHGLTDDQLDNIRKAFQAIDKDKSDSIELEELRIVCKAMNLSTADEDVQTLLKGIDKNGDGKIQLEEYIAMVASTLKKN
eukprot:TRINITY_DN32429_c0_g1_i1.p2 TRINITY_DN32429_c0_g1~~TRINITY_DN32429_c0_g1_i1.p2  ORF type:complete len:203 (+),score=72.86 TRINITY_DN32429_c0_g1_i1:62-670(+)